MKRKQNVFLMLFVLILMMMLMEGTLRLIDYKEISYMQELKGLDNRRKFQFTDDEKLYELTENCSLDCEKTNSYGMRDKEYKAKKPDDTIRILMIGDSVLFGPYIEDEDRFSEELEILLNNSVSTNVEVLNYGIPGYDIHQEYILFKQSLFLEPDIVILDIFTNDAAYKVILDGKVYEIFEEYKYLFDTPLSKFAVENSYLYRFFNHRIINFFNIENFEVYYRNFEDFERELINFKYLADKETISIYVVFHPYLTTDQEDLNVERQYLNAIERSGIDYIELREKYNNISQVRAYQNDFAHLNREGHSITAKAIYEFIFLKISQ